MKQALLLLAIVASLFTNVLTQTESTAPAVWERYRYSELNISVDLPKMPTVVGYQDPCSEQLTRKSFVCAEGAVYEVVVIARVASTVRPTYCTVGRWVLDQSTIDQRLDQLRGQKDVVETKTRAADLDAFQFKQEGSVRLIIPDITHQRLVELAITHYPNQTPEIDRLSRSFQFDAGSGKEIGEGSKVTLGDLVTQKPSSESPAAPVSKEKATTPSPAKPIGLTNGPGDAAVSSSDTLKIVGRPQARYTDLARKNNVQGTVRVKATLLANGAIGTVTAVTTLDDGLTEQAIAAARRLVFLPARLNGIQFAKTITIDYAFSIY